MSLKSLRESLCRHESDDLPEHVVWLLGQLINEIDRHRPLGSDGKHGDLHTATCGCEDKPTEVRHG
jgi:hypothetical protein